MSAVETVIRLAARGDGVTDAGRFLSGVAPGDKVIAEGDMLTIEPGPHRQAPPCAHFPECGGCQLQHVDDAAYAEWVSARIAHALETAGVSIGAIEPVHLSPPKSRRRASLRAVRKGKGIELGFNAESSHRIVDMKECHILQPALFALIAPLRELLAPLIREGQGAGVTMTVADSGIDLLLSNIDARPFAVLDRLTQFAATHGLARLAVETSQGVDIITYGEASVRFGGVPVALPPGAFLQATPDGEAALVNAVLAATEGAKSIADLFCGAGTFALPLSAHAKVHAADAAGGAVQALDAAARQAGRRLTTEHRDLFRRPLRAEELRRFDAVAIDPPRAGAKEQVAELAKSKVEVIGAVSCNPNTFARDAATLVAAGFRLERLWPVGQFRWSTHVELAARLVR